jgi:hypothetical protein
MSGVTKERILNLLGSGLSNEVVSTTVGCDPSYVSQLMSDEDFRAKVVALRTQTLTANTERDKKIDAIEDSIIEKLRDSLEYVIRPDHLLRAFAVVNKAARRGIAPAAATVINNTVVNLQLPTAATQKFTLSENGEVIEVEGRQLATMPAKSLLNTLAKRADGKPYAELARRIPAELESIG